MSVTRGALVAAVQRRLTAPGVTIWATDEIERNLQDGYSLLALRFPLFWDSTYLENLPRGFSYTQPWEAAFLTAGGAFTFGVGNYTAAFERTLLTPRSRFGPANYTSPFEATDGYLSQAKASTALAATGDLPLTVTALDRVTWDQRGIDALEPRTHAQLDSRYEITAGEVYGYMWQKDGIRTLRKVRVPSASASVVTVTGSWGGLRKPTDLSTETVTGTFGLPRRIPGHHPLGAEAFGAPRRPYLDGTNVRVEHFRVGRALDTPLSVCELPDRYAWYLRDYAQSQCLARAGPGQDLKLAAHFEQRWARGLARLDRRLQLVNRERIVILGGDGRPSLSRPHRPVRPWAYGSRVE